jgi:predicted transport protein
MPLFNVNQTPVKMVKLKPVANEREIHTLISDNLDVILGVRFLASEYAFPDGRIDTLGIDDNNFPVIIEYKKRKSSDVILQALFYKNWLMDHKAEFKLLCNEQLQDNIRVDWSNVRVIIVAQEFNKWDQFAVQQMASNIELKEYRLYEDNHLYLEDLVITEERPKTSTTESPQDIESYIIRRNPHKPIEALFRKLIDEIDGISTDIRRIIAKTVISYRTTRNFTSVQLYRTVVRLHLKFAELPEDTSIFSRVEQDRNHCHFDLREESQLDMALELFQKAYEDTL